MRFFLGVPEQYPFPRDTVQLCPFHLHVDIVDEILFGVYIETLSFGEF
jgi:hypothetical protein